MDINKKVQLEREKKFDIKKAEIINLPKILDHRGNLSLIEEGQHIPFRFRRVYWIYDVPGGEVRGGHAYKNNQEVIIAISGSFDVLIDNGKEAHTFSLNRSYYGLHVPNGMWRQMLNFSTNSLALIVASTDFDISDYIYDYNIFKQNIANEIF